MDSVGFRRRCLSFGRCVVFPIVAGRETPNTAQSNEQNTHTRPTICLSFSTSCVDYYCMKKTFLVLVDYICFVVVLFPVPSCFRRPAISTTCDYWVFSLWYIGACGLERVAALVVLAFDEVGFWAKQRTMVSFNRGKNIVRRGYTPLPSLKI